MLPLAHLGLGTIIGRTVVSNRAVSFLTLGIFLPDLIDKPIIFMQTGMFSNPAVAEVYGHSVGLVFLFYICGLLFNSRAALAIAVGMTTHLGVDAMGPIFQSLYTSFSSSAQDIWHSSGISYQGVTDHKHSEGVFFFEFIGLLSIGFQMFFTGLGTLGRQPRRRFFTPGFRRSRIYGN